MLSGLPDWSTEMNGTYDYNEEVKIDMLALHIAARDQPELMLKYCKAYALAKKHLTYLSRQLKVTRAEAGNISRNDGAKKTVDAVKEEIELDLAVNEMEDKVIEAQHQVDLLWGAVEAFKNRKSEISELVALYGLGYWSQTMTAPDRKHIEEQAAQAQAVNIQEAASEMEQFKPKLQK
jgi:hypothetical protein